MSGHRCFYFGCDSRKGVDQKVNEISFYRFPKKKETFIAWVNACQNPKIYKRSVKNVALYGMVCSKHFCYLHFSNPLVRKKVLKTDALPFPNEVTRYVVHDITDENFIVEDVKPDITSLLWSDSNSDTRPMGDHCAENVFSSPPHSPSGGSQKQKDLVSPRRLMTILESSCPLIRPISPTPSEADDAHDMGFPPLIPEVTMTTPFSPCNDSEDEDEDDKETVLRSPFPLEVGEKTFTTTVASSVSTQTTTVTTTSALGTATTTTPSSRGMTAKSFSEAAYLPLLFASKRPLEPSDEDEDPDWPKTPSRKRSKKAVCVLRSQSRRKGVRPVYTSCRLSNESDQCKEVVLNLSGLSIQKLQKTLRGSPAARTTNLYLDNNFLQALPTISSYRKLTKVSLVNNQIDSLLWFGGLGSLKVLNLSRNKLKDVDGLWNMCHLTHVNLSGNEVQVLTQHSSDAISKLESLDLSDNKISIVEDLSTLINLKELLLHRNRIKSLTQWKNLLPRYLLKLTLSENLILNLSDVAELSHLETIEELALKQNHCMNVLQLVDSQNLPVGPPRSFDYRPYLLTWCANLTKLDDRVVEQEERSKAQWLLSDEKFRDISVAKQVSLVTYLSTACPLPAQAPGNKAGQGQSPTLSTPRSSFPVRKVVLPLNNNNNNNNNLEHRTPLSITKNVTAPDVSNTVGCSSDGPCKHYVELIEEKAKNHKLQRKTEVLQARIDELMQRVELLETAMVKNGLSVDDLCIKIEVEDEHFESEN